MIFLLLTDHEADIVRELVTRADDHCDWASPEDRDVIAALNQSLNGQDT